MAKAAAKLGMSQSTLSHTIKRLETRMGLRLLTRTTRSVALTEAGDRVFQSLSPRISAIGTIWRRSRRCVIPRLERSGLRFLIMLSRPSSGRNCGRLCLNTPDNGLRNIVEDGFDAGVRLGESIEKGMIAVRIGPDWRMLAVASPRYLAGRMVPQHPQDLMQHDCINMRQATGGGLYTWEFEKNGQELRVRVDGQLTFNTSYPMVDVAVAGYGIAFFAGRLGRQTY